MLQAPPGSIERHWKKQTRRIRYRNGSRLLSWNPGIPSLSFRITYLEFCKSILTLNCTRILFLRERGAQRGTLHLLRVNPGLPWAIGALHAFNPHNQDFLISFVFFFFFCFQVHYYWLTVLVFVHCVHTAFLSCGCSANAPSSSFESDLIEFRSFFVWESMFRL